jgi:hypothetical protein
VASIDDRKREARERERWRVAYRSAAERGEE